MNCSLILQETLNMIRPEGLPSEEEIHLLDSEAQKKLLNDQNEILKII